MRPEVGRHGGGAGGAGGRQILFYSYWPLGYHNLEAERKAIAMSEAGYQVTYVTGIGMRNPTFSTIPKATGRLIDKVRHRSAPRDSAIHPALAIASVLVLPPRQLRLIRRFNAAWLRRQLRRSVTDWSEAIAWIRFPTPELVDAIVTQRPRKVVYECVDPYDMQPLARGVFRSMLEQAEAELVEVSDLVVVPGDALAERFRSRAREVRVIPHGVELEHFAWPPEVRGDDAPVTIGFIGTLDFRLDIDVLRHVAQRHPEWRVRLIGQLGDIFDPRSLEDLPNVSVEPPVPHERLGELIGCFSVGMMPYSDWPGYRYMVPVKNLEFMAAGRPAVARPNPALNRYADLLYFAETPEEYCVQLERALAEDSAELQRRRRETAEANAWPRRLAEIVQAAEDLAPPA
jgi:teichuronic acid biosynthesis glycosyltransferase TuaH